MELRVDGRRAYAYTGGKPFDATLPCVVFLHGALNDHSVWTLLARWFAHHGHGVLAPDLPGHGRSAGPPLADVESLGAWARALLDSAGVPRTAWVGHSMGSLIALEAASQAPERATHLAMIASAYPMKVSQALLDTARATPLVAVDRVTSYSISTLAAKPAYPGPGAWLHDGSRALGRRMLEIGSKADGHVAEHNLFHHDFSVCDRYARGLEAAAQVRCDTHLILGTADQMTPPAAARELATALKARVHRLPGGHALMQEQPDAVLQALRTALA
jgi:pimeloyl-ACP methyl ester carboxylesterase